MEQIWAEAARLQTKAGILRCFWSLITLPFSPVSEYNTDRGSEMRSTDDK